MATAMVRVSGVLLSVGMLMLSGCVIGHGPTVANALDVNLDVIVRYADGTMQNDTFKPGMMAGVGKGDWDSNNKWKDGDPWEAIPIEEVVIKEAGRVLHQFNAEAVRLLIEKQERDGGLWCIEREKVYLVQAYKYNKNPDARERCSKGKPFYGLHEKAHTYQSQVLGPLFIPTYFLSGKLADLKNPFESAAQRYGRREGHWWPW